MNWVSARRYQRSSRLSQRSLTHRWRRWQRRWPWQPWRRPAPHPGAAATLPRGVISVTDAPWRADPSGVRDATAALQAAIDEGARTRHTVFIPPGRYRVTVTLANLWGDCRIGCQHCVECTNCTHHFGGLGVSPSDWSMIMWKNNTDVTTRGMGLVPPLARPVVFKL